MKWITYISLGLNLVEQLVNAAKDGKISVKEIVDIVEKELSQLGISILDKEFVIK